MILTGNHAIGGSADSMEVEFDSAGHKLMESIYDRGEMQAFSREEVMRSLNKPPS